MEDSEKHTNQDRRTFLSIFPLGVIGAIAATFVFNSKRFLEPQKIAGRFKDWKVLGKVSEMNGEEPITKTVSLEAQTGWSKTTEDLDVFILPKHGNKVVSSVCPHEGCPIVWDSEKRNFLCPCHDSYFGDDGKRISGPSRNDLTTVKSQILEGELQIKV